MKLSKKIWIVAVFLYFLILLSIMLLADTGKLVNFPLAHPPYDKLGHFVLYGIASFLCHRATGKKNMNLFNYSIPFGPAIFTIFTAGKKCCKRFYQIAVLVLKICYIVFAGLQFFIGLEKFGIEKKEIERNCHTKFSWEVVIPF